MRTKAIVIPAANTIEMQDVELKPIGADDVLIRTQLTSISAGTERMLLKGVMPHPMLQFPVVPGYETVGEVIEAGDNADEWLGKRVYVGGNYGFIGVNPAFGGQSEYIVAPKTHLTDLQTLTPEQGVLLALAATALHGVNQAGLTPSDAPKTVVILGQGIVGQLAARIVKARGMQAIKLVVTDKEDGRLHYSQADVILNISLDMQLSGAEFSTIKGVDVLIDATGKMEAISPWLMRMGRGGRVVLLGYYDCINLAYQPVFLKELTLVSSMQWAPGDLAAARDLIRDKALNVDDLVTHRMKAEDASQAFDVAFTDVNCLKMVLEWPAQ